MSVISGTASLIQLLLYVAGLVAGILLRDRDGRAALLLGIGFGVQILGVLLSFAEDLVLPAIIPSTGYSSLITIEFAVSIVLRLVAIAAFLLVFLGLLRLVRGRTTIPGAAR